MPSNNQFSLFGGEKTDAVISACGKYRYRLDRIAANVAAPRFVNFIGLNPSTADASKDDPTIRRCREFAKDFDYDGFVMTNLFAYRSTDWSVLRKTTDDPIGAENDFYLKTVAVESALIIAAFGDRHRDFRRRAVAVWEMLKREVGREIFCLALTKHGFPGHPLYLPKTLRPEPFLMPQSI